MEYVTKIRMTIELEIWHKESEILNSKAAVQAFREEREGTTVYAFSVGDYLGAEWSNANLVPDTFSVLTVQTEEEYNSV